MREKSCLPYSHSLLRYVSRWGCASSLLASREPAALLPTQPQQTLPSVKGTVRFEAVVPKPKDVSLAADRSCAKQHPSPFFCTGSDNGRARRSAERNHLRCGKVGRPNV